MSMQTEFEQTWAKVEDDEIRQNRFHLGKIAAVVGISAVMITSLYALFSHQESSKPSAPVPLTAAEQDERTAQAYEEAKRVVAQLVQERKKVTIGDVENWFNVTLDQAQIENIERNVGEKHEEITTEAIERTMKDFSIRGGSRRDGINEFIGTASQFALNETIEEAVKSYLPRYRSTSQDE